MLCLCESFSIFLVFYQKIVSAFLKYFYHLGQLKKKFKKSIFNSLNGLKIVLKIKKEKKR